jgi:UPF0755 protein
VVISGSFLTKYPSATAALSAAVVALLVVWVFWLPPQIGSNELRDFVVSQGQGSVLVAHALEDQGFIRSEVAFAMYVNIRGMTRELKAGIYRLSPSMTIPRIADIIVGGKGISDDIEVTIPEGENVWEIDTILVAAHLLTREGVFSAGYRTHEGRLFPETYRFDKAATPSDIVERMSREFASRASAYTNEHVIIASIIEKEAKEPADMALVSGVIAKRLSIGMPLQVDATVGYGWCLRTMRQGTNCDVTQAPIGTEIKVDGPYNTYTRKGLPVGPISNPGLASLEAAAHPKTSDYLYYLSTRDGSQVIYSKTLAEHLQNRQKYLGF